MAMLTNACELLYNFRNEVLAYQPHPWWDTIYTLYLLDKDLDPLLGVMEDQVLNPKKSYVLVPNSIPARFANQASQGEIQRLSSDLSLEPLRHVGLPINLQIFTSDTENIIMQQARAYK